MLKFLGITSDEDPLIKACENKDLSEAQSVLEKHPEFAIHVLSRINKPLICHAVEQNWLDLVNHLLSLQIDVNLQEPDTKLSAFMKACLLGHSEIADAILSTNRIDFTLQSQNLETCFFLACSGGNPSIVKSLLAIDEILPLVNVQDKQLRTPLFISCEKGHSEIVEILVGTNDIDVNKANATNENPFLVACFFGHTKIVEQLVKFPSINVNQQDPTGKTGLYYACSKGHADIVKILVTVEGLDPNLRFVNKEESPLFIACEKGFTEIVKLLLGVPGIDVNQTNKMKESPFLAASYAGFLEIVELFLHTKDVDFNIQDSDGKTALMYASRKGFKDVVEEMMKHPGFNMKLKSKSGETAIDLCCGSRKADRKLKPIMLELLKNYPFADDPKFQTNDNVLEGSVKGGGKNKENKKDPKNELLDGWEGSKTIKWNRSKIMIVGAGRAGKTALTRSIAGERFDENLESTIGINEFECNVREMGALDGGDGWGRHAERSKLLESAIARAIKEQQREREEEKKEKELEKQAALRTTSATTTGGNKNGKEESTANNSSSLGAPKNSQRSLLSHKSEPSNSTRMRASSTHSENGVPMSPTTRNSMKGDSFADFLSETATNIDEEYETFDEKDYDHEITKKDIDQDEIIRCLAEDISLFQSKYIISIYDYGGQSVFNCIHPFLLTKSGIYLIAFDMRHLLFTPNSTESNYILTSEEKIQLKEKEDCLANIRFWLNAIAIHSYHTQRKEMAPIFLVGSRKDHIPDPSDHEMISKLLNTTFQYHQAWPYVNSNKEGKGKRGNTRLCFYPVDNRKGQDDPVIRQLTLGIEIELSKSYYVNQEIPIVWLKVLDMLKSSGQSYLSFLEVKKIANECHVSDRSLAYLLHFLHEMGLIMWHNESSLRDVIILDPVRYFVTPATVIICKHTQNEDDDDATWHILPIHEECRKNYFQDWQLMLRTGIISESLLKAMLSEYSHWEEIILLMKKYGLLLELTNNHNPNESNAANDNNQPNNDNNNNNNQNISHQFEGFSGNSKFYLVPSLLPEESPTAAAATSSSATTTTVTNTDNVSSASSSSSSSQVFYFAFDILSILQREKMLKKEKLQLLGYLPNGLCERLLCRLLQKCLKELTLDDIANHINRKESFFSYQGTKFRIKNELSFNCMEIEIFGANPIPIYLMISSCLSRILEESYDILKFITLLPQQSLQQQQQQQQSGQVQETTNSSSSQLLFPNDPDALINLFFVTQFVKENKDLQITIHDRISLTRMKFCCNKWLYYYKQSLTLSNYDLFLSYRWNRHDSEFVTSLFINFFKFNLFSSEEYSPISVFQDASRLQDGEDFRDAFVSALFTSRILIPIITVEALKKMIYHDENMVDNLLMEWILMIYLNEEHNNNNNNSNNNSNNNNNGGAAATVMYSGKRKILPIILGSYRMDFETKEIKEIKNLLSPHDFSVPKPIPTTATTNTTTTTTAPASSSSPDNPQQVHSQPAEPEHYQQKNIISIISNTKIIPKQTLQEINSLLTKKHLPSLPDRFQNITIAQIIEKMLLFKGIFLSDNDPMFSFPLKMEHFTNDLSERILSALYSIYESDPDLKQSRLQTANDYYFYHQPFPTANTNNSNNNNDPGQQEQQSSANNNQNPPVVVVNESKEGGNESAASAIDYDAAWACLQGKKSVDPEKLNQLMDELGIEAAGDLQYTKPDDLQRLVDLLKSVPQNKFREAMHF